MICVWRDTPSRSPMQTDVLCIGMGERYDMEFVADKPAGGLIILITYCLLNSVMANLLI
jgi:hypothetical protein